MLIHAGARVFYENEDLACPTQLACKTALLKVLMNSDPKLIIPFGNLLGKNKICFIIKYSIWSAHVRCEISLTLIPWYGWISTWEYWIWITVKLSYYYFVTRMASTFFLLPFCFKPFIHFWYCHLVCWKYDRDLLKDDQIGLSWELLIYVRAYFRITVCQKASATILINQVWYVNWWAIFFFFFWNTVFSHIVSAGAILFWIWKSKCHSP